MAHTLLQTDPIDVTELEALVGDASNGAVCVFIGQTRRLSRGREVVRLEYQAFTPMAQKALAKIAQEAEARWSCQVAMRHRLGVVALGEASVVIAVGSPHRSEAFEACRFCIDTLKEQVPIWKKEICPDGSFWIEGADAIETQSHDTPRP